MSTTHPQAAAHTSTGRVRRGNEDAFGFRPERGIFVVCDGMGGAAGGEVASRLAVDTVLETISNRLSNEPAREALRQAVAEANDAVHRRADADPGLFGMGTTLVALLLPDGEKTALVAHAGDSRAYLFRNGRLSRCTNDHSLVHEQMRIGAMTAEEAERSPLRSVITRAIGTQPSVTPDLDEIQTAPEDLFLLCTDGLTRELEEDRIAQILAAEPDLDHAARQLIDAANNAGGRDNVTCLLVRVS
jgi:serine/threonine protein phosphatase PrpC